MADSNQVFFNKPVNLFGKDFAFMCARRDQAAASAQAHAEEEDRARKQHRVHFTLALITFAVLMAACSHAAAIALFGLLPGVKWLMAWLVGLVVNYWLIWVFEARFVKARAAEKHAACRKTAAELELAHCLAAIMAALEDAGINPSDPGLRAVEGFGGPIEQAPVELIQRLLGKGDR